MFNCWLYCHMRIRWGDEWKPMRHFQMGKNASLLRIDEWDFSWHSDYRYKRAISLPRGTVLSMRYTYDNSTNNIRNPNNPPREIVYGTGGER